VLGVNVMLVPRYSDKDFEVRVDERPEGLCYQLESHFISLTQPLLV
jgi:hypothetical protein